MSIPQDTASSPRPRRKSRHKSCETCGAEFYVPPSKVSQRWCSMKCVPSERRTAGPQHRRQGEDRSCAHCGATFYATAADLQRGAKFCSRPCFFASGVAQTEKAREKRRKANSDRQGQKNPNFRHGKRTEMYHRHFNLTLKGETRCRNCGGVGDLHLHHAVPRSRSRAGRANLLNGVPLCPPCHHGWHHRKVTIYRDVFTADEWALISSLENPVWLDDRYPQRATEAEAA